jgi:hypothetical protein
LNHFWIALFLGITPIQTTPPDNAAGLIFRTNFAVECCKFGYKAWRLIPIASMKHFQEAPVLGVPPIEATPLLNVASPIFLTSLAVELWNLGYKDWGAIPIANLKYFLICTRHRPYSLQKWSKAHVLHRLHGMTLKPDTPRFKMNADLPTTSSAFLNHRTL